MNFGRGLIYLHNRNWSTHIPVSVEISSFNELFVILFMIIIDGT